MTGDAELAEMREELLSYPGPAPDPQLSDGSEIMVELRMRTEHGDLAFFSTITTFGTAFDITLSELSIEAFFPANEETGERLLAVAV
jgi:hypothetical protein